MTSRQAGPAVPESGAGSWSGAGPGSDAGPGSGAGRGAWLITGARPLGGDPADILLSDGMIADIRGRGEAGAQADARVLDAAGLIALPGLVDLHAHLREPGREDAETVATGTAAAALGGFLPLVLVASIGGFGIGGIWAALTAFIGIRLAMGLVHWRGRAWLVPGTLTVDGM